MARCDVHAGLPGYDFTLGVLCPFCEEPKPYVAPRPDRRSCKHPYEATQLYRTGGVLQVQCVCGAVETLTLEDIHKRRGAATWGWVQASVVYHLGWV